MTGISYKDLCKFDPEIDKTFHILQRSQRELSNISIYNFSYPISNMANNHDKTPRELVTPDVTYQPLCIKYLKLDVDFELRSRIVHLLLKF